MEPNRNPEAPKPKIAVVCTHPHPVAKPEEIQAIVASLIEKGYEVVPVEQASHTVGDQEITDFVLAARANARAKQLTTKPGDEPYVRKAKKLGRKAQKKIWMRELQARAFKGE